MGAKLEKGRFNPNKARWYGLTVKLTNVMIGVTLYPFYKTFDIPRFIWILLIGGASLVFSVLLTERRIYKREKELLRMSIEEILTIYLPIPLLLGWGVAIMLMSVGVLYFFLVNKVLWEVPYPKV